MEKAKQQVKDLLGRGFPEVSLNGDRFRICIPTGKLGHLLSDRLYDGWKERVVFTQEKPGKSKLMDIYQNSVYGSQRLMDIDYGTCIPEDEAFTSGRIRYYRKNMILLDDYNGLDYLPMLVPLTKSGDIDETFSETCPDMSETEGGCFRFDGEDGISALYGMPKKDPENPEKYELPHLEEKKYRSIQLVEHEDGMCCEPIRWVSFAGVLVAWTPIFRCHIGMLKKYRLLLD